VYEISTRNDQVCECSVYILILNTLLIFYYLDGSGLIRKFFEKSPEYRITNQKLRREQREINAFLRDG